MKNLLLVFALTLSLSAASMAQSFRGPDKSPMDVAYLPDNFAHDRKEGEKAIVKVYYSRPFKNGRVIFGGAVPFGKVWRLGANEAVEFVAFRDITIGGQSLKAGSYSLFAIPGETEWTIIVSSDLDYWGAFSYQEKNDVLRFTVASKSIPEEVEAFSIRFESKGDHAAVMRMGWDQTMVEVAIGY